MTWGGCLRIVEGWAEHVGVVCHWRGLWPWKCAVLCSGLSSILRFGGI